MAVAILAVAGCTVAIGAVTPAASAAAPVVTPTIDRTSRASVANAYQSSLAAARDVPVGWTGSTSTCTKGTESPASIEATRAAVNFYRAMNGLPPVTMDATLNAKALAAALIMQANPGVPNHFPPTTWACYTADGAAAAAVSNLTEGGVGARAIDNYLEDAGPDNTAVGHRRWVLDPRATTFGTGSTSGANALTIGGNAVRPAGVDWISWPNAGFVPKTLVTSRFSLSSNTMPDADYTAATITVKVGSTNLTVVKHPVVSGYGDNTLAWEVTLPAGFATSAADVTFDTTVTGIKTAGGAAVASRTWSSTAFALGAPTTPTNVTATRNGTYATVQWTAPSDNGTAITGYEVVPFINGVEQPLESFAETNSTIQVLGPLAAGGTYTYKVRAINALGRSPYSATSNGVTSSAATSAPSAPPAVTATAGNSQATVSWTPSTANGGSPITGHVIVPYIGATAQTPVSSSGAGTTKVVTGLTNGATYTFEVLAENAISQSQYSPASNPVTPAATATAPGAPTGVTATAGNSQATVTWTAPSSNGGSAITGYRITPYLGATAQAPVTSSGAGTTKVVTGLTSGATYTFKVAATNAIGTGTTSPASNPITPAATDITAPVATMTKPATRWNLSRTVGAAWSGSDAGSGVSSYDVVRRAGAWNAPIAASPTPWLTAVPSTSSAFTGVKGSTYCTKARARDHAGNLGAYSTEKCTAIPLTADQVSYTGTWARSTLSTSYGGFYFKTTQAGAKATRTGVVARRISLIATRCTTCGPVKVYWNGVYQKTVSLNAANTMRKQTVELLSFSTLASGTLQLVSTPGTQLIIEGLGISKSSA